MILQPARMLILLCEPVLRFKNRHLQYSVFSKVGLWTKGGLEKGSAAAHKIRYGCATALM